MNVSLPSLSQPLGGGGGSEDAVLQLRVAGEGLQVLPVSSVHVVFSVQQKETLFSRCLHLFGLEGS